MKAAVPLGHSGSVSCTAPSGPLSSIGPSQGGRGLHRDVSSHHRVVCPTMSTAPMRQEEHTYLPEGGVLVAWAYDSELFRIICPENSPCWFLEERL